ncbi:hypothetical protein OSCI_1480026 [Kamptonema sp. PCC 6506]|nr:hypothetical protein OSCI_1480026 [Kamptonema sp. PCC 6506]
MANSVLTGTDFLTKPFLKFKLNFNMMTIPGSLGTADVNIPYTFGINLYLPKSRGTLGQRWMIFKEN